jgi:hypothetical protein
MLFALWTVQSTAGASCLSMKLVPNSTPVVNTSHLPVGITGTIVSNNDVPLEIRSDLRRKRDGENDDISLVNFDHYFSRIPFFNEGWTIVSKMSEGAGQE